MKSLLASIYAWFKELHWWLRLFQIWIVIFTAVVIWQSDVTRNLSKDGTQARMALCAFKADLKRRIDAGNQFLKENPNGIPGIPASVINTSIINQQMTLASLSSLKCKK